MPPPPNDKVAQSQLPEVQSLFMREGKSFLAYLSKICVVMILLAVAVLAFNGDSPDRLRPDIPQGISAGKTVYHNTRWLRCSVAVFELEPEFLAGLRAGGIPFLNSAAETSWQAAPMIFDDSSRWPLEFATSVDCIGDKSLQTLFNTVSEKGGYYQVRSSNSVSLIAPDAGLMMVGGYD